MNFTGGMIRFLSTSEQVKKFTFHSYFINYFILFHRCRLKVLKEILLLKGLQRMLERGVLLFY